MTRLSLIKPLLVLLMLALAGGCATLPPPSVMQADVADFKLPKLPSRGKAMVYVVRPSIIGSIVRFNVFVDDKEPSSEVGFTRGKQYIYFEVAPGRHTILSKAENWADTQINAKAGDIYFLEQEPATGFIMARNNLLSVPDYQGKYLVKRLDLGTLIKPTL